MARIVELKWNCSECDSKDILGRHKSCPNCGAAREKGEMKMGGLGSADYDATTGRNRAATVTDSELLNLATAGADWFCTRCSSGNTGNGDRCSNCGGPREGVKNEDHPDAPLSGGHEAFLDSVDGGEPVRGFGSTEPEVEAAEPPPRAYNPKPFDKYDYDEPPPDEPAPMRFEPPRGCALPFGALVAGGVALLGLLVWGIVWCFSTHPVPATVTGMTWEHKVTVSTWTQTTTREWKHKTPERAEVPPVAGRGERAGMVLIPTSCREEHFDDERYVCGSHEECEDVYRTEQESYSCSKTESYTCGETCSDNGNGFATCRDKTCSRSVPDTCSRSKEVFDHKSCHDVDDYCTRPILKFKCSYTTQEWVTTATPTSRGTGEEPTWPEPYLEPLERATRRASYGVTLSYTADGEAGTYPVEPTSLTDYTAWSMGDTVTLDVNNLGGVSEVHRGVRP